KLFARVAHLEEHLSLDNVEPLLLVQVVVKRGTAVGHVAMFEDKQAAISFAWQNLEQYRAVSARMRLSQAILPVGHNVDICSAGRNGRLRVSKGLDTGGQNGCRRLEKRTTSHALSDFV